MPSTHPNKTQYPEWNRGINCWGWWTDDITRTGFIAIPLAGVKAEGYGWYVTVKGKDIASGRTRTLKAAKNKVERAYSQYLQQKSG